MLSHLLSVLAQNRRRASQCLLAMQGTWLCPSLSRPVLRARTLFIACMLAGLMQKPLIKFAWDVQAFVRSLLRVHSACPARDRGGGAGRLLGGTAILLRQVFASQGQAMVAEFAASLAVAGQGWTPERLRQLCVQLETLQPRHHMKRKGRMARYSGPQWIRKIAATRDRMAAFHVASKSLSDFLTAAVADDTDFHQVCKTLKAPPGKLFQFGDYSVPHLVRACSLGRAHLHADGAKGSIKLDANAWTHLRNMHDVSTKATFDTLGVHSFGDALAFQKTVLEMAARVWSTSVARHFTSVSLVDLPCQACEFGGILGAVKRICGGGDSEAMAWLFEHLPGDLAGLKAMGQGLKQLTAKSKHKGDGLDKQAAGAITRAWLHRCPVKPEVTLQQTFTRGGGGLVPLPQVWCPGCRGPLEGQARGRKRKLCAPCISAFRKHYQSQQHLSRRRCRRAASN